MKEYREIQSIAKKVLEELSSYITPLSTETSIANEAISLMQKYGVQHTWYHGVPAFVLLGSRSCDSISGRDYVPSD